MTNKELDSYMKTVDPNFDSHLEKGTIEMNNEYYNLLEEKMARLINENQELKKQLSSKTLELEKNKTGYIRSLNNQLSENIEPDPEDFYLAEIEEKANDYDKLLIQQKEFIKHLTDEINKIKGQIKNYDIWHEVGTDINFLILKKQFYIEILQKYKEIIGNDINVGSKGENK